MAIKLDFISSPNIDLSFRNVDPGIDFFNRFAI